jgi:hypothetical protein
MTNAGSLTVRNGNGMNRVRIMKVENEQVVIAATGGDRKLAGLVRIRLEKFLFSKRHGTKLMAFRLKRWSKI